MHPSHLPCNFLKTFLKKKYKFTECSKLKKIKEFMDPVQVKSNFQKKGENFKNYLIINNKS